MEPENMQEVKEHGSTDVFLSSVVDIDKGASIYRMHFDPHGSIGGHFLSGSQIFLIVEGESVFWDTGEWQEAGLEGGMTVILLESKLPAPAAFFARF